VPAARAYRTLERLLLQEPFAFLPSVLDFLICSVRDKAQAEMRL
jgi:hypothetical protein